MMAKLYHIDEFETYEAGEHGRGKSGLGKSMGASKSAKLKMEDVLKTVLSKDDALAGF